MIVSLIILALAAYGSVLFARIILSFFPISPPEPLRPVFSFLFDVTEPFLRPFRGLLPPIGGFDFSPLIAFVVLRIAQGVAAEYLPRLLTSG